MNDKNLLCPNCQTGANALKLDEREPMCPYLSCHNGKSCSMFVPLEKADNKKNQ